MALISYWLFVVAFPQLIGLVGCAVPTHLKAELLRTLAALARYFQLRTTLLFRIYKNHPVGLLL